MKAKAGWDLPWAESAHQNRPLASPKPQAPSQSQTGPCHLAVTRTATCTAVQMKAARISPVFAALRWSAQRKYVFMVVPKPTQVPVATRTEANWPTCMFQPSYAGLRADRRRLARTRPPPDAPIRAYSVCTFGRQGG